MLTDRQDLVIRGIRGSTCCFILYLGTLAPVAEVVLRCGYGTVNLLYTLSYETVTQKFLKKRAFLGIRRFRATFYAATIASHLTLFASIQTASALQTGIPYGSTRASHPTVEQNR